MAQRKRPDGLTIGLAGYGSRSAKSVKETVNVRGEKRPVHVSVDQILSFGDRMTKLPLLDDRPWREIRDELNT